VRLEDVAMTLIHCEEQPTSLSFVAPINERLDQLVELADEAGARTTRKELMAALILAAPDSEIPLRDAVLTYRTSRARDAAVLGDPARVLELRHHRPGPRRKRANESH
jgi:hypothetical protein